MTTEERLDALERELTRAKRLLVVAGLIAIALALIWTLTKTTPVAQAQQADAVPKEVRASRFVLEDEEGVAHAMLAMYEGNPWLQLGGESGIAHASMTVANGEPTLVLKDKDGKTRVLLNGSADMPGLQLHDENGERRAWLSMIEGTPILGLCDPGVEQAAERRTRAVSLTVMAAKPGWGLMLSEGDKTRCSLLADEDGGSLMMHDWKGRVRAAMHVLESGPFLTLMDEREDDIWHAPR